MVEYNSFDDMLQKTQREIANMPPVNIMLIGKTGVGKSTLINALFRERLATTGIGRPITKHLRKITKEGVPIQIYDTKGFELNTEVQKQVRQEVLTAIQNSFQGPERDKIHVIYFCINAHSSRIEDVEIAFIQELTKILPVIIVLTQSIGKEAEKFKSYIDHLNLHVKGVINILAKPFELHEDYIIPVYGLKELMELTFAILPEEAKRSFNNAQQVDLDKKARAARSWATKYVTTTFGVGFVPIPFADASILVPMQITMLAHITAIFGISMDRSSIASIVAAVGGTGGATYIGRSIVANALKFIPGAGTLAGGLISGATASLLTTALAMSYIKVLMILTKQEQEGKKVQSKELELLLKKAFQEHLRQKKK